MKCRSLKKIEKKLLFSVAFFITVFASLMITSCTQKKATHTQEQIEQLKKELEEEFNNAEITVNPPEVQEELNEFMEHPDKLMNFQDNRYIAYLNDVYMFPDAYTGHKILVQGQYKKLTYDFGAGKHTVDFLYRETNGCEVGSVIEQGFEFLKPSSFKAALKDGQWIEISGTIEPYEEKNITFVRVKADSLKIMSESGTLFVE